MWDSGCLGVQIVALGRARRLTLDAYYPSQTGRKRLAARLRRTLGGAGAFRGTRARLSIVGPGRWVEAWQRTLRPMAVDTFLIVPEGCRTPSNAKGRHILRVRYGQAFGTGEHASTRLCLHLLRRHLRPGLSVLDLGTGSGILAMAACRLGAGRVVALDNDAVALGVARANLRDNGLLDRVELVRDDASSVPGAGPFDLALVNIGATTILKVLPSLATALSPGGKTILAGVLIEDEGELTRAATAHGLARVDRRRSKPWSALVLARRDALPPVSSPRTA